MTPSSDPDHLIARYLSNRASENEKRALEEWLQASEDNRRVFEQLKKVWAASYPDEHRADWSKKRDRIWQEGMSQPPRASPRRISDSTYWSKVAAVFFVIFLGAGLLWYLIRSHPSPDSGLETIAAVEKVNPPGRRSVHRLPDGTRVSLNAESRLLYPEKFADTLRKVSLEGEAFFEVARDPTRPFIVEAADTQTQALGTAFNIRAYPEDNQVSIALVEGAVKVQSVGQLQDVVLAPGEELRFDKGNQKFTQQPFDYESTFGWKEGLLIFDGADFTEFRRAIERWYGVSVEVVGPVPADWRIRARYQNEDLRHVLRDISFNKHLKFELNDKNLLITF